MSKLRSFKDRLPLATAVVIATGGVLFGVHERFQAVELSSREQALTRTMGQLELQMQELNERLNKEEEVTELAPPEAQLPPPMTIKARPRRIPVARVAPERKPDDQALRRVEILYADEEQKIASARQEVEIAREDLEGKLSTAKDELNDSITKTHDKVVALQKQAESDYTEFTLEKLKDFLPVGPVSLALRKIDTKHQRYNLELIVDQVKLEKKNVNLHEPIYLTLSDQPQPVVLVVNQITKNEVRGYVGLPKYKKSDLLNVASMGRGLPESAR
jgi:hypothetical protein